MTPTDNQHPIQTLATHPAYPSLSDRVRPRSANRATQDLDTDRREHRIELRIAVTDQKPQAFHSITELHQQILGPAALATPQSDEPSPHDDVHQRRSCSTTNNTYNRRSNTVSLEDETTKLSAFDADDDAVSLRAVLSWSFASLDDKLRRAFGLLGIAPLGEIGASAAASLWVVPPARAAGMLRSLETGSLVHQHKPGRFQMHDLVRLHEPELAARTESLAALRWLVHVYAHTARTAGILLYPHRHAYGLPELPGGCHPVAWLDAEHASLVALLRAAADLGWTEPVWHVAHGLDTYQCRLGLLADNVVSSRLELEAATAIGSARLRASSLRQPGRACTRAGDLDEAEQYLTQALRLEEDAGTRSMPPQRGGRRDRVPAETEETPGWEVIRSSLT